MIDKGNARPWRNKLHEIIFEADTPAGKLFDVLLIVSILLSVGYGDISPKTNLGQALSSLIMIIGYGIIAVPTGIVTVELSRTFRTKISTRACMECSAEDHASDAKHCKYCGAKL